ncbi:hypothetical protein ACQR1Y_03270 [Bradyrhizobium sp. HKCCYLRH3099]
MMLLAGLLLITIIITWFGTEYVISHVVIPLVDGDRPTAPDMPSP